MNHSYHVLVTDLLSSPCPTFQRGLRGVLERRGEDGERSGALNGQHIQLSCYCQSPSLFSEYLVGVDGYDSYVIITQLL
jgi:hypothetical protein